MDENRAPVAQERYDFQEIEKRWQDLWEEQGTFIARDDDPREKLYVLQMFPYPSGDLHAGHVRNYVLGDAVARFWRMHGYNVMHPMGFDSFGLPAEQAAIDRGIQPRDWIATCVERSRRQFRRYGFAFDWMREVVTSDPSYYRWTQWLFLKFYELGLIYRKEMDVNWCEEHGVLANDEVKEGQCWRCDRTVTRRKLEQWNMRTTDYAEQLLQNLDQLSGWNDAVRTMQRNWIGRSEGTHIDFEVPALGGIGADVVHALRVYTTRVDTAFGVTFMAIAPDHPLAEAIAVAGDCVKQLRQFAEECAVEATQYGPEDEKPKRGMRLNVDCVNPFNGERVPIFATNYVVASFGTGAVMGVPSHDTRDFAFAQEYSLPVKRVIVPAGAEGDTSSAESAFTDKGVLVDSGSFTGMAFPEAKAAMDAWLAERGLGGGAVQYRLRDWNMSRQRFWGAPIPMIKCPSCGWQPVPYEKLPITLPDAADYSDIRVSPLANDEHWKSTRCPKCSGPAERETDTMTTFMDSAWYFLRFTDPGNDSAPFDAPCAEMWMPVDYYVGGKEHAVGHLLYSRFITLVLEQTGLLTLRRPDPEGRLLTVPGEPFRRLFNQGIVYKDGAKMSKSRGNVVSSDELAEEYGADTARLFAFFGGPYDQDLEWSTSGVEGSHRFLRRLWRMATTLLAVRDGGATGESWPLSDECNDACLAVIRARHIAVAGVTQDVIAWRFNTAIAKLMQYLNAIEDQWKAAGNADSGGAFTVGMLTMAQLLCPFAPHLAEELWHRLGGVGLCVDSDWPMHDPEMLVEDTVELAVQVNGKVRGRVTVAREASPENVLAAARADEQVAPWLDGKHVVKEMVVPGRLVTFVVK